MTFMAQESQGSVFFGKTWIYFVQAFVLGGFSIFSLIVGPLFFFGVLKDVNHKNATLAGAMLSIIGILFFSVFCLAVFNIMARRRPLIRLCREGIEFNIIGASTLDKVFFVPGMIRVAWLLFTLQGFKSQIRRSPWQCFHDIKITGLPMCKVMTIVADIYPSDTNDYMPMQAVAQQLGFREVAFNIPLDQVAHAIQEYASNELLQCSIYSWNNR
jgi:hypothetical protein